MKLERPRKPIQFAAITLPYKQMPNFPDIGDWKINADNSLAAVLAADTGNDISNAAILLHEFIEGILCWIHGVREEDVLRFDKMWFEEQSQGKHTEDDEPGYDPRSPYRDWHLVAERFEREFVEQCGMMWQHHSDNCESVYKN